MNRNNIFKHTRTYIQEVMSIRMIDEVKRRNVLFDGVNALLAVVAFVMSVINYFTNEYALMTITASFGGLCVINIITPFIKNHKMLLLIIFMFEVYLLFSYFIVSGNPDGFSVLWATLLPCFALLIFGSRDGSICCLVCLAMLIFFFWTPWGKSLLMYQYHPTFMMRFPFFYSAIYIISFFLETIRSITQRKWVESEQRYVHLYRHDALTSLNNRTGFYESLSNIYNEHNIKEYAVIMVDIDDFKKINDTYGHPAGDQVLKCIADKLNSHFGTDNLVCRWGGEEFIVLHMTRERENVTIASDQLRWDIEENDVCIGEESIHVTVSIGICKSATLNPPVLEKMIRIADDCLYRAKANGKNQVIFDILLS